MYAAAMALSVKDLMQKDVITVREGMTVAQTWEVLESSGISGAPVVNERGEVTGVISRTDLVRGWQADDEQRRNAYYRAEAPPERFASRDIREVMMSLAFFMRPDDELAKAAKLMRAENIHRVIVVDGGKLVGVLSASDIVAAVADGRLGSQEERR